MNLHNHIMRAIELAQASDATTDELYVVLAALCALARSQGQLEGVRETRAIVEAQFAISQAKAA